MSESNENPGGIEDEDLPEDLQPTEDNPLAQDPDEDELPHGDDLFEGKDPEETETTDESAE